MPVYLLHGFRWPREAIRIHIILQNLDDAAAEWLVAPATTSALLDNFNEIYADCMEHLPELRFVEQYDPNDTKPGAGSQPYAYVADVCEEVKLGVDIDEVRGRGVPNDQWASMMELRDKLAKDQKVAWYIVVCGDEERWAPGLSTSSASIPNEGSTEASQNDDDSEESYEHSSLGGEDAVPDAKPTTLEELQQQQAQPKGFKKFFSTIGKQKSRSKLETKRSIDTMSTAIRDQSTVDSQKYAPSVTNSSNSSTDKARIPSPEQAISRSAPAPKSSLTNIQTHHLASQSSHRTLLGLGQVTQSPGGLSLIPDDDEDHEIITGPSYDDDEDLAAPAPTVKHGKQQDLVRRQKRSSISSFKSAMRGSSPETLRNIAPLVRQRHDGSFSSTTSLSSMTMPSNSTSFDDIVPTKLQLELMRDDIEEEPIRPTRNNPSPPASYRPTGAPSVVASIRTSRSTSPVKLPQMRQRSNSRLAALAALEGDTPLGSSPPRRSVRGGRSRRSSAALNPRASQYSMSSMSTAMAGLYGAHEREYNRNRQSVTQDDLVARGLDNMDFGALR